MFRNVFKIDIFSPSSHLLLNQCLSGIDLFTANRWAKSPSNTPDTRMFTIRKGTAIVKMVVMLYRTLDPSLTDRPRIRVSLPRGANEPISVSFHASSGKTKGYSSSSSSCNLLDYVRLCFRQGLHSPMDRPTNLLGLGLFRFLGIKNRFSFPIFVHGFITNNRFFTV